MMLQYARSAHAQAIRSLVMFTAMPSRCCDWKKAGFHLDCCPAENPNAPPPPEHLSFDQFEKLSDREKAEMLNPVEAVQQAPSVSSPAEKRPSTQTQPNKQPEPTKPLGFFGAIWTLIEGFFRQLWQVLTGQKVT
ncbi:MAG: hypothetical protein SFZ03_04225 [Candidatus Melainabacteria bacterium]|nr:hypothetical protein [Candidatus Melainabacteria bacterium]